MMFRDLNEKEISEFKSWARENYEPGTEIKTIWHPVVQKECAQINLENCIQDEIKEYNPTKDDT